MNKNYTAHTPSLFYLCSALCITLSFSLCCYLKDLPILPPGPDFAISTATQSLAESFSLSSQYFKETYDQAARFSKETSSDVWQDVFALSIDGTLVPKHSLFSVCIAVPFYVLFGKIGFWVLQQLFTIWLLYSTYVLSSRIAGRALPWSTLLSTCFLTQTLFYSYNFSYDLHGCALYIGGLCLLSRFPFLGGIIMTLSLFVRPAYLLLIIPIILIRDRTITSATPSRALIGSVLVVTVFLFANYILWGDPLLTSYSRLPSFHNGEMQLYHHPMGFHLNTFFQDWNTKLFGSVGLLPYNLSVAALPFMLATLIKAKKLSMQLFAMIIGLTYAAFIFSYPLWYESFYGNRFLFPSLYLYLLTFIPVVGRFEKNCLLTNVSEHKISNE